MNRVCPVIVSSARVRRSPCSFFAAISRVHSACFITRFSTNTAPLARWKPVVRYRYCLLTYVRLPFRWSQVDIGASNVEYLFRNRNASQYWMFALARPICMPSWHLIIPNIAGRRSLRRSQADLDLFSRRLSRGTANFHTLFVDTSKSTIVAHAQRFHVPITGKGGGGGRRRKRTTTDWIRKERDLFNGGKIIRMLNVELSRHSDKFHSRRVSTRGHVLNHFRALEIHGALRKRPLHRESFTR